MKKSFSFRTEAVSYVSDLLLTLSPNSALTMTIVVEKSGDCYVLSAIDVLSGDTEMQEFSKELQSIYEEELLDGSSHLR